MNRMKIFNRRGVEVNEERMNEMKGFIGTGPSIENLMPTPEESFALQSLLEWQEQSAKSNYIFGPSIACPKCHVENNPNNAACYQCAEQLR